jgi:cytochrome c oxidase assembly protein subunit 15
LSIATEPKYGRLNTSRWLHRWAVLTVCAAVPLLFLGAEVTTKKVGMADPVGFRAPWHLLTILERAVREIGLLIEHSHRLMGFIVGGCIIVLAVGLWLGESRRWVRWLGAAALAGVCIQGLLGKYRVDLNALVGPELALIHGCFAQLVFATLVGLAVCTSRRWSEAVDAAPVASAGKLQRWTIVTAALIYLQLVLGAFVRHTSSPLGQRGHLLAAFGVVASVVWLFKLVFEGHSTNKALRSPVLLLGAMVALQIVIGVEAWIMKFSAGMAVADFRPIEGREDIVRTAHYLIGAGVFSTAVAVALEAHRQTAWGLGLSPARLGRMEGAL